MKMNEEECENRDFYYFIINKNKPFDCFFLSLKGLKEVVPNPAEQNHPFQCVFNKNREIKKRSFKEARKFLLSNWAEAIKKNIKLTKEGMPEHYPDFIQWPT